MAKKIAQKKKAASKSSTTREISRKVPRSAKSGLFVTEEFAEKHPSTTVVETVKVRARKSK